MIKPEKFRNDSEFHERIHMFAVLFEMGSEKQIKSGKLSIQFSGSRCRKRDEHDL